SLITVPTGTVMTRSSPPAPWRFLPMPLCPFSAFWCGRWRSSSRVDRPLLAVNITSPPLPPSPPLGPPNSMNFSCRKAMQPAPPWPDVAISVTSSINFIGSLSVQPFLDGRQTPCPCIGQTLPEKCREQAVKQLQPLFQQIHALVERSFAFTDLVNRSILFDADLRAFERGKTEGFTLQGQFPEVLILFHADRGAGNTLAALEGRNGFQVTVLGTGHGHLLDATLLAAALELDAIIDPGRETLAGVEMPGTTDRELPFAVHAALQQPEHEIPPQPLVVANQGRDRIGIGLVGLFKVFQQLAVQ